MNTAPLPAMFSEDMSLNTDKVPVKVVPPDELFGAVGSSSRSVEPTSNDGQDRRTHRRIEFGEIVHVTIAGRTLSVRGLNISDGGMSLEPLPHWTRRGDPVMVQLAQPQRQLLGRVVWVRKLADSPDAVKVGLRFTTPKPGLVAEVC